MSPTAARRKRLGAWYTPDSLVSHVLDEVLDPLLAARPAGGEVSVLDPACGDGRFLAAAAARITAAGRRAVVCGIDIDATAVAAARAACGEGARIVKADALARRWGGRKFDLVVGNPPFLSPLAAIHGVRLTDRSGGPYADAAAEFLALALRLARPDGGRVGLVMPLSIVATRDATPVRDLIADAAELDWFWFAPRPVFDAEVRTCALGLVMRRAADDTAPADRPVRRTSGKRFVRQPDASARLREPTWAWLLADQLGIPPLPSLTTAGTLGEFGVFTADFRDEYYGLAGAVEEAGDALTPAQAPLVTSGLIDAGVSRWGERSTRFLHVEYARPVVRVDRLTGPMAAWAAQRLVPKVLVASQTRVLEALADPEGRLLPSVPVVTITPNDPTDVWRIAAALTGPVASAWLAARASGTGMSAHALRVSAPVLAGVPIPAGSVDAAVAALQVGEIERCARLVTAAYGVDDEAAEPLLAWWLSGARVRSATLPPGHP